MSRLKTTADVVQVGVLVSKHATRFHSITTLLDSFNGLISIAFKNCWLLYSSNVALNGKCIYSLESKSRTPSAGPPATASSLSVAETAETNLAMPDLPEQKTIFSLVMGSTKGRTIIQNVRNTVCVTNKKACEAEDKGQGLLRQLPKHDRNLPIGGLRI